MVVGPRSEGTQEVALRATNWLAPLPPEGRRCTVKLRARDVPRPAWVRPAADGALVHLDVPALPAPGQACVAYDNERVLGGGVIRPAARAPAAPLAARWAGS